MIDWIDLPNGLAMPLGGGFFMRGMKVEPATPERELPEFAFSPKEALAQAPDPRFFLARGRERPLALLPGYGPSLPLRVAAKFRKPHKGPADDVWGKNFSLKFSKAPDPESLPTPPSGALKVIGDFLDRVEEMQHYDESQCCAAHARGDLRVDHDTPPDELSTTLEDLKRARIDARSLDLASEDEIRIANEDVTTTHYGVIVTGPDGSTSVGDARYIAAMRRRIEWEQFRSTCGPLMRAKFEPTPDGRTGIDAYAPGVKDKDAILDLRRHVKNRWLASHEALPAPDQITLLRDRVKGKRTVERLSDAQRKEFTKSRLWADEDEDPGRVPFHADPDPRPQRSQYAYGDCRFCDLPDDPFAEETHNACTIDGDELFALDYAVWQAEQLRLGDVGYAGPSGALGLDIEAIPDFE